MRYILIIFSLFFWVGVTSANDDKHLFNEIKRLAENGSSKAQYHLGMFYNNGIGTQKNVNKAFEWFEKSASSGDPLGYYKLGCYYSGQGLIVTDHNKALEYKLVAAREGYALAQYDVASLYYQNGEIDKAIMWWKKSANQGYPDSIYALFVLYFEGKGVPRDTTLAYGYLRLIEKNMGEEHNPIIEEKLRKLKSELSKVQLEQAQYFVKNWSARQTTLTIRATGGKEESKRIAESAQGK